MSYFDHILPVIRPKLQCKSTLFSLTPSFSFLETKQQSQFSDRAADFMTGSRFLVGSGLFLWIQTKIGTLPPLDSSNLLPNEYLGKFHRVREERTKMATNCILSDVTLLLPHHPFVFMI
jgi:hypothetical protein